MFLTIGRSQPSSEAEAALALRIKQPNLIVLINALEAETLIERQTDDADRRNNRLVLAPAGRALLRRIQPAVEAMEAKIRDRLGSELQGTVTEGLKRPANF